MKVKIITYNFLFFIYIIILKKILYVIILTFINQNPYLKKLIKRSTLFSRTILHVDNIRVGYFSST